MNSGFERSSYYDDPVIRTRLGEFFGGDFPHGASAVFFSPGTESASHYDEQLAVSEVGHWLAEGAELNRSLWDRDHLIAHLDVEHVHFDHPREIFASPDRPFALQRPVQEAASHALRRFGIQPFHQLTGRGHHLVWKVSQNGRAFERLASLGRVSGSLAALYASSPAPTGEVVSPKLGAAFAGLGLVMEYLAHLIKAQSAAASEIPVEMGAVETIPSGLVREIVSLDITEYADPLIARSVRVPFSFYLKPYRNGSITADNGMSSIPSIISIPRNGEDETTALKMMRNVTEVRHLATHTSARIPDFSDAMEQLIEEYEASRLRRFHDWFYGVEHDPEEAWPHTYDFTSYDVLPEIVRAMLESPNDALLRPGCVKLVVGVLLSLGWHPRHIGGLIRSKYERDHGWGRQWEHCDPATRADFYARLFTGLFVTRLDDLIQLNPADPQDPLLPYQQSLFQRRQNERLASRPLHGLFSPQKDL